MITALAWRGDGLHLFLAAAGAAYLLLMLRVGHAGAPAADRIAACCASRTRPWPRA
jgi:hypothetical protein